MFGCVGLYVEIWVFVVELSNLDISLVHFMEVS